MFIIIFALVRVIWEPAPENEPLAEAACRGEHASVPEAASRVCGSQSQRRASAMLVQGADAGHSHMGSSEAMMTPSFPKRVTGDEPILSNFQQNSSRVSDPASDARVGRCVTYGNFIWQWPGVARSVVRCASPLAELRQREIDS